MNYWSSFLESFSAFFSTDPSVLFVQGATVVAAVLIVFLLLFATRDIFHRTHSLAYQLFSIVLVALLPVVGFLLYLLIRPSRTLRERALEEKIDQILAFVQPKKQEKKK